MRPVPPEPEAPPREPEEAEEITGSIDPGVAEFPTEEDAPVPIGGVAWFPAWIALLALVLLAAAWLLGAA
jgi:hypothetical protein